MAKKQTRRSVSLNRGLYELAKKAAELQGKTLSQWTAELMIAAMPLGVPGKIPLLTFGKPEIVEKILATKAAQVAKAKQRQPDR